MKKILVIAMMALFSVSAFALSADFKGLSEISGKYFYNGNLSDDEHSQAMYVQKLRLWATVNVDENTKIVLRSTPLDDIVWASKKDSRTVALDRAYLSLRLGSVEFNAGRIDNNNFYANTFGTVHYDMGADFGEGTYGLKLSYIPNSDMKVFAIVGKINESVDDSIIGASKTGEDADLYIIGADLGFGDVRVVPSVAYGNDNRVEDFKRVTANVGVNYNGDSLAVKFAAAMEYLDHKEGAAYSFWGWNANPAESSAVTFGAYVEATYYAEAFHAGALVAYAGADDKAVFYAGGNFTNTFIVDGEYFDDCGMGGMLTAQIYAGFSPITDLELGARVAYYMSMLDKNNPAGTKSNTLTFNEDSSMLEIDLDASYQLTPSTALLAGLGYVMNTDVYNAGPDEISDVFGGYWMLQTKF